MRHIIYRVEKNNLGPYSFFGCHSPWSERNHNYSDSHPRPNEDGIKTSQFNFRYGFKSIAQLKHWFNELELAALAGHGFVIKTYSVRDTACQFGSKQVCFNYEEAIPLREYKILVPACETLFDIKRKIA